MLRVGALSVNLLASHSIHGDVVVGHSLGRIIFFSSAIVVS